MFVRADFILNVPFQVTKLRLANLARGGLLTEVSADAYDAGLVGLMKVGPLGDVPGASKLVRVHTRELVVRGDSAVLTLRWDATGPGGGLFPALDADISLTPSGADTSQLTLHGAYRPPLAAFGAGLDRAVLHRVARATARSLLNRIAETISQPDDEAGD